VLFLFLLILCLFLPLRSFGLALLLFLCTLASCRVLTLLLLFGLALGFFIQTPLLAGRLELRYSLLLLPLRLRLTLSSLSRLLPLLVLVQKALGFCQPLDLVGLLLGGVVNDGPGILDPLQSTSQIVAGQLPATYKGQNLQVLRVKSCRIVRLR